MFFKDFAACVTAFLVASSQLKVELDNTSITFNTAIEINFNIKLKLRKLF